MWKGSSSGSLRLQLGDRGCNNAKAAAASLHLLRIIARGLRLLSADAVAAPRIVVITAIVARTRCGGGRVLDQHSLHFSHLLQSITL
jgi:hypothetical protein